MIVRGCAPCIDLLYSTFVLGPLNSIGCHSHGEFTVVQRKEQSWMVAVDNLPLQEFYGLDLLLQAAKETPQPPVLMFL